MFLNLFTKGVEKGMKAHDNDFFPVTNFCAIIDTLLQYLISSQFSCVHTELISEPYQQVLHRRPVQGQPCRDTDSLCLCFGLSCHQSCM